MTEQIDIYKYYSNLSDNQLILIKDNESSKISESAKKILNEEIKKRKIVIEEKQEDVVEKNDFEIQKEQIRNLVQSEIWRFVYNERKYGAADKEIISALKQYGLGEIEANYVVSGINEKLNKIIKKNYLYIFASVVLLVITLPILLLEFFSIKVLICAFLSAGNLIFCISEINECKKMLKIKAV